MTRSERSGPMTHGELMEDLEMRKRMLWEAEGRIFALACEMRDRRDRGEPTSAVSTPLQFMRTTIGHWETIRNGIEQRELILGLHRRELP